MNCIKRSVCLSGLLLSIFAMVHAQQDPFASAVYEYKPAPGQHINDPSGGTPVAASHLTGSNSQAVSLGAFGGYIILKFGTSVENHPDNPFGVDFLVAGNAFEGSAEPGIVKVMKDENSNGIPDDTWYELAGSRHHGPGILKSYAITYYNPYHASADVPWTDNRGENSFVFHNDFHSQPYYPEEQYFPSYNRDSVSFNGSLLYLEPEIQEGIIRTGKFSFGYADCNPVNREHDISFPDNPYTPDTLEGYGGDAFDISWAVDSSGNYIDLTEIDFIMIYSASNAGAGILGEVSTEVSAVIDIPPAPGTGYNPEFISLENMPEILAAGGEYDLNAVYFENGRMTNEEIRYSLSDPGKATIEQGKLKALSGGTFVLQASLESDPAIYSSKKISIKEPSAVRLNLNFTYLPAGETGSCEAFILDQDGKKMDRIYPRLYVADTSIAEVGESMGGRFTVLGKKSGSTKITAVLPGRTDIMASESVEVVPVLPEVEISLSVKNGNNSLLPRKVYRVGKYNIKPFIERETVDVQPPSSCITLAEAIAEVFAENGFTGGGRTFRYRADEYGGNKLYLWQVGKDWEFWYGWGGYSEDDAHKSCWIIAVNDTLFISDLNNIEVQNGDRISIFRQEQPEYEFRDLVLFSSPSDEPGKDTVFCRLNLYAIDAYGRPYLRQNMVPENQQVFMDGESAGMLYDLLDPGKDFFVTGQESAVLWLEKFPGEILQLNSPLSIAKGPGLQPQVYPAPFIDRLYIRFDQWYSGSAILNDMQGREVFRLRNLQGKEWALDVPVMAPGIYLLKIVTPGGISGKMVVKGASY